MLHRVLPVALAALLVSACSTPAEQPGGSRAAACAPATGERVVHAWKGGQRFCFVVASGDR
jgi:hypothetical protein